MVSRAHVCGGRMNIDHLSRAGCALARRVNVLFARKEEVMTGDVKFKNNLNTMDGVEATYYITRR